MVKPKQRRFTCKCGAVYGSAAPYRQHAAECVFAQLPPGLAGPTT
jgi:hypothetical protein